MYNLDEKLFKELIDGCKTYQMHFEEGRIYNIDGKPHMFESVVEHLKKTRMSDKFPIKVSVSLAQFSQHKLRNCYYGDVIHAINISDKRAVKEFKILVDGHVMYDYQQGFKSLIPIAWFGNSDIEVKKKIVGEAVITFYSYVFSESFLERLMQRTNIKFNAHATFY